MSISEVSTAETWIKDACLELGLQTDIKIVSVTNRWRWTLEYEQDPKMPDFGMNMMRLEAKLQDKLKRPIDLRLERVPDKNMRDKRNVLTGRK